MRIGLQIPRFHWKSGPREIGQTLANIGRAADEAGIDSIWVMDHFFQIASIAKPEEEMLEAYTTLGFLAAHTHRVRLGTLVTGVHYRHPGALIKQVTTLDVLSGGRAWLGIGAGWYERESRGLGIPFPPRRERFARLEETLKIAHAMFSGARDPIYGKQFQLAEPINSPAPLSRLPIMVGGGGEQVTLRLVAKYADACNLFTRYGPGGLARKLEVLREHCDAVGRDYDEIDRTSLGQWDPVRKGPQSIIEEIGHLHDLGFTTAIASVRDVDTLKPIEALGRDVVPFAAGL